MGEQVDTVLVHANAFLLGVLGQGAVKAARYPSLELARVLLEAVGLVYFDAVFDCGLQPCLLGIQRVGNRSVDGVATCNAAGRVGEGGDEPTFILVLDDLHSVVHVHIFIKRFHYC